MRPTSTSTGCSAGTPSFVQSSSGTGWRATDPFWLRLVSDDRLLDIAQQFIGPDLALFATHYICKPPRTGQPVHWHQDGAFHPNILHSSSANTSDRWRRALTIRYIPTSTRITRPDEASPFLLRGRAVDGVNDYREAPRYRDGAHMPFTGSESWR